MPHSLYMYWHRSQNWEIPEELRDFSVQQTSCACSEAVCNQQSVTDWYVCVVKNSMPRLKAKRSSICVIMKGCDLLQANLEALEGLSEESKEFAKNITLQRRPRLMARTFITNLFKRHTRVESPEVPEESGSDPWRVLHTTLRIYRRHCYAYPFSLQRSVTFLSHCRDLCLPVSCKMSDVLCRHISSVLGKLCCSIENFWRLQRWR